MSLCDIPSTSRMRRGGPLKTCVATSDHPPAATPAASTRIAQRTAPLTRRLFFSSP